VSSRATAGFMSTSSGVVIANMDLLRDFNFTYSCGSFCLHVTLHSPKHSNNNFLYFKLNGH